MQCTLYICGMKDAFKKDKGFKSILDCIEQNLGFLNQLKAMSKSVVPAKAFSEFSEEWNGQGGDGLCMIFHMGTTSEEEIEQKEPLTYALYKWLDGMHDYGFATLPGDD